MSSTRGTRTEQNRSAGFSLIELLVVVTIIGILASVVVLNLGGKTDEAKVARVNADFKNLDTAVDLFRNDHGIWPESIEELVSGPAHPTTGEETEYIKELPSDPWTNQPYELDFDDRERPYFISYGADQAPGGEGINQDLSSNEKFGT